MKIVKFQGGLGNQMFQYALLRLLEKRFGEPVYADTTMFGLYPTHRFELEYVFRVGLRYATDIDLSQVCRWNKEYYINKFKQKFQKPYPTEYDEKLLFEFDDNVLMSVKDRYYAGYWINYKYLEPIKNELIKAFEFKPELSSKNQETLRLIRETESVSIHVRRGNYLKSPVYQNVCEVPYYQNAINTIKNKLHNNCCFFIFSNDIKWCNENIKPLIGENQTIFVDWNGGWDNYVDMQLMSNCKHNIIAHSTFSWFAAWLNNNDEKIVICPSRWTSKSNHNPAIPGWISLENKYPSENSNMLTEH